MNLSFAQYLRTPKSEIPQYMRDLIDEAVAAGRITKIAPGVSAESYMVWDQEKRVLMEPGAKTAVQLSREAYARAMKAAKVQQAIEKPPSMRRQMIDAAQARRDKVMELYTAGRTYRQIADALGCNPKRVKKDVYEMLKAEPKLKRAT